MLKNLILTLMIFSPALCMTTIRVALTLDVVDLKLEQLDMKTISLHGDLNDKIYLTQLEGFVEQGKRNLVCQINRSLYGLK